MTLGCFGDLVFEVSDFKVLTLDDFQRNTKANYAEHKTINNVPILEFINRELETISFKMTFVKYLGIDDVLMEVQTLRDYCKNGEFGFLIIGDHAYGENNWVITDLKESVDYWDGEGKHLIASVDVTMKEYAELGTRE